MLKQYKTISNDYSRPPQRVISLDNAQTNITRTKLDPCSIESLKLSIRVGGSQGRLLCKSGVSELLLGPFRN